MSKDNGAGNSRPLVTICVPTYNNALTVSRAIDSAVVQFETYPNIELLVVDDASTDSTVARVTNTRHTVPITVRRNDENLGLISNHNRCVDESNGELIMWLHADDELKPGAICALVDRYLATSASVVCGQRTVVTDDEKWLRRYGAVGEFGAGGSVFFTGPEIVRYLVKQHRFKNVIGEPSSVLVRRASLRVTGAFRHDFQQLLDLDLWLRLAMHGGIASTGRTVAVRHHGVSSATFANRARARTRFDAIYLLKSMTMWKLDPLTRFFVYFRLATELAWACGHAFRSRGYADFRELAIAIRAALRIKIRF